MLCLSPESPCLILSNPVYLLVRMTFFSGELTFVSSDCNDQFYIVVFFEYWNLFYCVCPSIFFTL